MRARIQKWGNTLALRIPKALADETGLDCDSSVKIYVVDGEIHIVPVEETRYQLESLLGDITAENRHGEVDTEDVVGNEV
jgi:antitoxin MazE